MLSTLALGLLAVSFGADASPGPAPPKLNLLARKVTSSSSLSSSRRRPPYSPSNIPLTDFFSGTDLQWYGNISVGTPPQEIPVVFDTGSYTLEFASVECGAACRGQIQFNGSKSSTYIKGNTTTTINFSTGGGVNPVESENEYALTLRTGEDVVSVAGLSAGKVSLYTIINQTAEFDIDPYSGIQGLGPQAEGFFAGLVKNGLPSLFSLYLTPEKDGGAELTLGGIDSNKFSGSLTYASLPAGVDNWELGSPAIYVNGQTTSTLNASRSVIFDSGTSNVLFDTKTTEAIYAMISPDIVPYSAEPGAYGIACSKIAHLPATIDIGFTSQQGVAFNLTIPSSELSVGPFPNQTITCQTLVNAFDGLSLVGGSLLKHYYSTWDIANQRMGFAPNGF